MTSVLMSGAIILSVIVVMVTPGIASPAGEEVKDVKRSLHSQPPSPQMEVADRLLKRVLDVGTSREDLERVQQKRSFLCYFQAVSCY